MTRNSRSIKLPYVIVQSVNDAKSAHVRATYKQHFLELQMERRSHRDGFGWFGEVIVDGRMLWRSPSTFARETKEVLEMELQLQLFHWALRQGYVAAGGALMA